MLVEEIILALKSWASLSSYRRRNSSPISSVVIWLIGFPMPSITLFLLLFSFNRTNDRVCVMNDLPSEQEVDNNS